MPSLTSVLTEFGFHSSRDVTPRVLPQMILSIESLAALGAHVPLLAGMYDEVQGQLLLPLERLHANGADVRPLGIVALLVTREVVLALQAGAAYVANESSLQGMTQEMLLQQLSLRVCHVAFRAAVEGRAVQRRRQAYLARLRTWLLLLRRLLLFLLLVVRRHHYVGRRGGRHGHRGRLRQIRLLLDAGILEKVMYTQGQSARRQMTEVIGDSGARCCERLPRSRHRGWRLGMRVLLMVLMHRVILLGTVRGGLAVALLLIALLFLALVLILKEIANILLIYGFCGLL